jgi:hypothetical protein
MVETSASHSTMRNPMNLHGVEKHGGALLPLLALGAGTALVVQSSPALDAEELVDADAQDELRSLRLEFEATGSLPSMPKTKGSTDG